MDGHLILGTCLFQINRIVASLYFAVYLNIFKIKKKKNLFSKSMMGWEKERPTSGGRHTSESSPARQRTLSIQWGSRNVRTEQHGAWKMGHGPTQRAKQDTERSKTTPLSRSHPELRRGPAEAGPLEKPNSHRQWKAYDLSTSNTGLLLQDLGSASRSEWEPDRRHKKDYKEQRIKTRCECLDFLQGGLGLLWVKNYTMNYLWLLFKTILQTLYLFNLQKKSAKQLKSSFCPFFLQVSLMPSYVTVAQFSRTGD